MCGETALTAVRQPQVEIAYLHVVEKFPFPTIPPLRQVVVNEITSLFHEQGSSSNDATCKNQFLFNTRPTRALTLAAARFQSQRHETATCYGRQFLRHLFWSCYSVRLQGCAQGKCRRIRESLEQSAPECKWRRFREWTLTFLSCYIAGTCAFPEAACLATLKPGNSDYDAYLQSFYAYPGRPERLFDQRHMGPGPPATQTMTGLCTDVTGTLVLNSWAWCIHEAFRPLQSRTDTFRQNSWRGPPHVQIEFNALTHGASDYVFEAAGVCPNRLWSIAISHPSWQLTSLALSAAASETPLRDARSRYGSRHEHCSEKICRHSDDNSTNAAQIHKCSQRDCELAFLPPKELDARIGTNETAYSTAWDARSSHGQHCLLSPGKAYMAVSHVWLDGTGAGNEGAGNVNACLLQFWFDWALKLGCEGVWWDAICVPADREKRAKAINAMHKNFRNAKCILVHDTELVNFEWKDDGSPLIALLFSAWFTRGWTAAELFAAQNSKILVLFKGQDGVPVAKDLDHDILSYIEAPFGLDRDTGTPSVRFPRLGHFIAAETILRVRSGGHMILHRNDSRVNRFENIRQILGPRYTSWNRDRMIIAGIFCLEDSALRSSDSSQDITKAILKSFKFINMDAIVHFQPPIEKYSAWSWCPPSLFELGQVGSDFPDPNELRIGKDGSLTGEFGAYQVIGVNSVALPSRATHPAVEARINNALLDLDRCVLLLAWRGHSHQHEPEDLYLLALPLLPLRRVTPEEGDPDKLAVECHAVAWVRYDHSARMQSLARRTEFHFSPSRGRFDPKTWTEPQRKQGYLWQCHLTSLVQLNRQKRQYATFEEVEEAFVVAKLEETNSESNLSTAIDTWKQYLV